MLRKSAVALIFRLREELDKRVLAIDQSEPGRIDPYRPSPTSENGAQAEGSARVGSVRSLRI